MSPVLEDVRQGWGQEVNQPLQQTPPPPPPRAPSSPAAASTAEKSTLKKPNGKAAVYLALIGLWELAEGGGDVPPSPAAALLLVLDN